MHAGDKVRHVRKPSEPFASSDDRGLIFRTTPAFKTIPAQAFVLWGEIIQHGETRDSLRGDYDTWENQIDLVRR